MVLNQSDIEFIKRFLGIAVRALVVSACWAVLAIAGILLRFLLNYMSEVFEVPERLQALLSTIGLGYPVMMGTAMLVTSMVDIANVVIASFSGYSRRAKQEPDDEN